MLEAENRTESVNVILTDDEELTRLNERFKARKGPTDVLSFPFEEEEFLGEIYVSLDRARAQARRFEISEGIEIKRLVLHGLLHLLGYSHHQMQTRMKRYLE